ncbi:MAG TPA: efflux RND transporter periplasmic adaptor subunit [Candidatus Acidoferrales bacterium]|nr:efflux RND transporter periplasmic adaptor subunit [Candidatus Acidoferrales bacterium]
MQLLSTMQMEKGQLARLAGVLLAAGILFSGCGSKGEVQAAPTVTVQVDAAEKEPIQRKVVTDAVLYPRDQAAIQAKVVSSIKKWDVDKGSHVKAGQLLGELENQDLTGAAMKSEGGLTQAEATYQMQLQKSGQDLKFAKQSLDSAQKFYDGRAALYKEGAVSAKDLDDASVALAQSKNTYDLAQKQYDLKVAEGAKSAAEGDTANAKAMLSYTKIISPIDGVVTDRPNYPGETPATGTPIITVMDLSQIVARAHVAQTEAASLKVGNPATITIPGQPILVKGRVSMVSPAVDPNSTTVEVWVQAPNPKESLRPGTSVRVAMVAETVKDAIVIPQAALLTSPDGVNSVIVLDSDNTPSKKKVKIGIRDSEDKTVQVTDGLQGGERVVTIGAFELANEDDPVLAKTKIQVQAPKMPDEDEDE